MLMRHQPIADIGRVDKKAGGVRRAYHRVHHPDQSALPALVYRLDRRIA